MWRGPVNWMVGLLAILMAISVPAIAMSESFVLENQYLLHRMVIEDGRLVGRQFENRLTRKCLALPAEEFSLRFQDGTALDSAACEVKATRDVTGAEFLFSHASGVEVRVRYSLPPEKPYLRKSIAVRQTGGPARRLVEVDLENWKTVSASWRSMRADYYPYGSHPIYCDDLWTGVEFVAAFNEYGDDGLVLRSRPGGPTLTAAWLPLHSTVIGVAEGGQVRPAFLRYIEDIRIAPARMVACYNSWWTLPEKFSEKDMLDLAANLKRQLFDKHGVFFDFLAIDAGWSEQQSIWEIGRKRLPNGFGPLRNIVESAKGRLGLWISPSAHYPAATDCQWAEHNGYTVVKYAVPPTFQWAVTGISLADPKYLAKTKEQLKQLIRDNGLEHVKFDGLIPLEESPHHDLLAGKDSVEPLVQAALDLLLAAKEANPSLVTEPTFLNSLFYISPWIVQYADTQFGTAGGDYPRAIGPAPDYRESCTNAREWYIFSSLDEVWLPQNVLQYFDIIHCDAAGGLANHLAMAIGRGRFFLPVYVNPKYVSDAEWELFAGLLRWARANQELLRQTVVLRSPVEVGEPYCYAHWLGRRGMLAVRNPSNESKVYYADLRAAGAPRELADAICYTQFPNRRGIATGVDGTSTVAISLAPWELAFVEVVPRSELREPVAMGARWYCDNQGKMRVSPERGACQVEVLQPGGQRQVFPVSSDAAGVPSGKVLSQAVKALPKTEWLEVQGKAQSSVGFDVECSVTIPPDAARGKVLMLVQFPYPFAPSRCTATVNGAKAALDERSSSAYRLGDASGVHYFDRKSYWAGEIPYATEWTWYICELKPGESRVRFAGCAGRQDARIGLWVWSERDCTAGETPLPLACTRPEMPQYQERLDRTGVCLIKPGS